MMRKTREKGERSMHTQNERLTITIVLHIAGIFTVALFVLSVYLTADSPIHRVGDCVIRDFIGIYCPGCGGTRAVMALLQGDVFASFIYYPLLSVTLLLTLYWDGVLVLSLIRKNTALYRFAPWQIWLSVPILLLVQWILRNVLFFTIGYDPLGDLTAANFL